MLKSRISLNGTPMTELQDVTCHIGSHNVTCYPTQVNAIRPNPSPQKGRLLDLPTPEGCVHLCYPAMKQPVVELATSRSQVQRPNYYTTEPPDALEYVITDDLTGNRQDCSWFNVYANSKVFMKLRIALPVYKRDALLYRGMVSQH